MNDQHAHAGYVGYDGHAAGSFDADPLFGSLPGSYEAGQSGQYDASQWNAGTADYGYGYDAGYAGAQGEQHQQQYETAAYPAPATASYDTAGYDTTGQWDATAWNQASSQTGQYENVAASFGYGGYDGYEATATGQWVTPPYDTTGQWDATAWNADGTAAEPFVPQQFTPEQEFGQEQESGERDFTQPFTQDYAYETPSGDQGNGGHGFDGDSEDGGVAAGSGADADGDGPDGEPETLTPAAPVTPRPVRRSGGGGRGRRRTPAKRSALLTVAVPSACVMGVAGIAAASVNSLGSGGDGDGKDSTSNVAAAAEEAAAKSIAANSKIDTQLAALSADARDFGDRASRTQERIDLKARQEAERKKREEEAKRREALRPKFMLPVKQHGLSAYYGQAGINWMSVHTGIDFPVAYGTPVMAATDGTVRTQWNSAYGNMAIVTAPDGTETWYCHLSSTKIRSGSVKAGDVIAYAGNSGNSTGPHLHFEVRPGGGSAVDPLTWLRGKGLDPT
ncbi:M23 family metallopeptidase [Streptomyces sp. PR69]|uniref:M23 family metallopeptidase n=1 Tax=Streptomyces sp. PR69 TaxID=2984950 RepID=UPI0022654480|nr:peptidoglycan DD-metalloendopeptidase family protein [Streptomyces sp. PR69]